MFIKDANLMPQNSTVKIILMAAQACKNKGKKAFKRYCSINMSVTE